MANFVTDVFGDTPDVAPYIKTIFSDEQLKAIQEDIAAMPRISSLGGQYYDYMMGLMNRAIPGFSDILAQGGTLTKSLESLSAEELAGQIPPDVAEQVQRSSAFQNLLSGGGGAMASANTARNLGLTSLDMTNLGAQNLTLAGNAAQRWAGLASGMIMNPASFFVTPQQQAALTMQNNLYKQATQQLRNNLSAAPDPVAAGVSNTIMNVIGAYIGHGGMGAGGGGAGGGAGSSSSPTLGSGAYGTGGAQMSLANPNFDYGGTSQFPGVAGSVSNLLGGNLGKGGSGVGYPAGTFQPSGGGGNYFGGGGGPGSGAGTSALGVAGTTSFPINTGSFVESIPNMFGPGDPFGNISIDPSAFGTGQFDPVNAASNMVNPFNMADINLGNTGTVNPNPNSLSNLLSLFGSNTGTTDFVDTSNPYANLASSMGF